MALDSVNGALCALLTKYGTWESEGACSATRDRGGEVPKSYLVLNLSEEDRTVHRLVGSSILIWDNHRRALDDIFYYLTAAST